MVKMMVKIGFSLADALPTGYSGAWCAAIFFTASVQLRNGISVGSVSQLLVDHSPVVPWRT